MSIRLGQKLIDQENEELRKVKSKIKQQKISEALGKKLSKSMDKKDGVKSVNISTEIKKSWTQDQPKINSADDLKEYGEL